MIRSKVTRNYEGMKVFIGIDVHKRTYSIAAICEDVIVKAWSMTADPSKCVGNLLEYFKEATI